MQNVILSWLLSFQMLLAAPDAPSPAQVQTMALPPRIQVQEERMWWGLIDPELAVWFSRITEEDAAPDAPVLWDFSWRGFLAALFGQPMTEEVILNAPRV